MKGLCARLNKLSQSCWDTGAEIRVRLMLREVDHVSWRYRSYNHNKMGEHPIHAAAI